VQRGDGVVDLDQGFAIRVDCALSDEVVDADQDADDIRVQLVEESDLPGEEVDGGEAVDRGVDESNLARGRALQARGEQRGIVARLMGCTGADGVGVAQRQVDERPIG